MAVEMTLVKTNERDVTALQVGDTVIEIDTPQTMSVSAADRLEKAFPNAQFKRKDLEPARTTDDSEPKPKARRAADSDTDKETDPETGAQTRKSVDSGKARADQA